MKTSIRWVVLLTALTVVSACAFGGHQYVPHQGPDLTKITVKIVNDNWLQAKVYVIYGNARPQRLVTVTTKGEAKIEPNHNARIYVKLFADRWQTWTSELLFWAKGGDCVLVRVSSLLSTSSVMPCN